MSAGECRRIQVVIADDHPVVREGLRSLLLTAADMEVIGEAGTGAEAVARAQALQPEVMLLDIRMPGGNGLAVLKQIKAVSPRYQRHHGDHARQPRLHLTRHCGGSRRIRTQGSEPPGFPHGDSHRTQTFGSTYACPVEQNPASGVQRRTDVGAVRVRVNQPGGARIAPPAGRRPQQQRNQCTIAL